MLKRDQTSGGAGYSHPRDSSHMSLDFRASADIAVEIPVLALIV